MRFHSILWMGGALLMGVSWHGAAQSGTQWEYLKVAYDNTTLSIDNLNQLGQQCWQLVACPVSGYQKGYRVQVGESFMYPYAFNVAYYCVFKRPNPRTADGAHLCPVSNE